MADASDHAKFLNPWLLHHQKLGLELKCPLCLNLLSRPMLLPCHHIFCDLCVPRSTQFGAECVVCNQQYADLDVRPAPYTGNLVAIYRSLDATFSANFFHPFTPDDGKMSRQPPASSHTNVDDGLKESIETPQDGNCSNGKCPFSLTTKNKRIRAPFKHTTNRKNKLIRKSDESAGQITSQEDELKIYDVDGALEIDINQVLQSSSPVPPPFFDTKSRDDNSSDPGSSNRSSEKYPAKRLLEKNISRAGGEIGDRNYSKIPKKVNCGFATSKWGTKFGELSGAKEPIIPDLCHASESICAFCQSSILSDRTGPMLHYANGKAVGRDAEKNVNVIHVHEICLEWAPQAYFLDQKVKNLKAEVARAAKLKCSGCGLKGAALGCLVKSCRKSYHVPCAIEILGCRWDFEDFLMLCPNHSSVEFPREKKFGKNASEKQHFVPTEM